MKILCTVLAVTTALSVFGFTPEQYDAKSAVENAIENNQVINHYSDISDILKGGTVILDQLGFVFEGIKNDLIGYLLLLNKSQKKAWYVSRDLKLIKYNSRPSRKAGKTKTKKFIKLWQVCIKEDRYVYIESLNLNGEVAADTPKRRGPRCALIYGQRLPTSAAALVTDSSATVLSEPLFESADQIQFNAPLLENEWRTEFDIILLEQALARKDAALLKTLLADSAIVGIINELRDEHQNTLLHRLVHKQSDEKDAAMIEVLLQSNVIAIDSRDAWGRTALHWAVMSKKLFIVALLLHYGSGIDIQDFQGHTFLDLAINNNSLDAIRSILVMFTSSQQ